MTFSTVPDKSAGDVFTEAMWDTYIRDNLNKGVMRPIADTIVSVATSSITFSSIPADYAHLFLEVYARGDTAATAASLVMRLNSDAGANYDAEVLLVNGATVAGSEQLAATSMRIGQFPANTAVASAFASTRIGIDHYQSAAHKSAYAQTATKIGTATGNIQIELESGHWRSTAVINAIQLLPSAGNFAAGCRATLYGLPAI